MHHATLDRWSRGASPLHRRDPRAKIAALLVFLAVVATSAHNLPLLALLLFAFIMAGFRAARVPLRAALLRAAVVLPFTSMFAAITWLTGDHARAGALLVKPYLSALAVLLLVSTTALPVLLRGLELLGVPRFLIMVAQFLYRYLFVISEEAQHMSKAAASRGATVSGIAANGARFRAAAGALAVLFARSYNRAGDVHRAMLARCFPGYFHVFTPLRFTAVDALFLVCCAVTPIGIRLLLESAA